LKPKNNIQILLGLLRPLQLKNKNRYPKLLLPSIKLKMRIIVKRKLKLASWGGTKLALKHKKRVEVLFRMMI